MSLYNPLSFDLVPPESHPVDTNTEIPKDDLDIFYQAEQAFLPTGKDFKDLTAQELKDLKNKYRFACMKPGVYQGITGMKGMI